MGTTLFAASEATIEDLLQVPDNAKAEIVNGKGENSLNVRVQDKGLLNVNSFL